MLAVCFLLLLSVAELNAQAYVPVMSYLGAMPEFHDELKSYDLKVKGNIPAEAKEVLVYVFVTTHGDGNFQRGYYEMFTHQRGTKFTQFLNVATGQGVMAVNSANLWFPVGDGKLDLKLIHSSDRKRSIAGKREDDNEWSGVFVIGYRVQ